MHPPLNPPPLPAWHTGSDNPTAIYLGDTLICLCVSEEYAVEIVVKMGNLS